MNAFTVVVFFIPSLLSVEYIVISRLPEVADEEVEWFSAV